MFALAGPRVAKHVKETTRATYARAYTRPYQEMGTGKLKLNGNLFRSSPVQLPFNSRSPPVFFKRAPVVPYFKTATNDDSYIRNSVCAYAQAARPAIKGRGRGPETGY